MENTLALNKEKFMCLLDEYQVSGEDLKVLTALGRVLESETDFFTAPASTKYHAAYPGGLFDHCLGVTQQLIELNDKGVCTWGRPISPFLIGILHDATKFGAYLQQHRSNLVSGDMESYYIRNLEHTELSRIHGEDSVLKASVLLLKACPGFLLSEEECECIRWHMGAYEGKDSWAGYDAAIRKFPNVLWTHTADMYASKVMEVPDAL